MAADKKYLKQPNNNKIVQRQIKKATKATTKIALIENIYMNISA